jgi:hypothetical protein
MLGFDDKYTTEQNRGMAAIGQSGARSKGKFASQGAAPREVHSAASPGTRDGAVVLRDGDVFTIMPEGRGVRFKSVGKAAHGRLTHNPNGSLTYRPDPDFEGRDSFTYKIADRRGRILPATVTLNIEALEGPPDAVSTPDSAAKTATDPAPAAEAPPNPPADIPDEIPDDAPDGPKAPVLEVSNEILGTLEAAEDGGLVYTPPPNFIGIDRFGYRMIEVDGSTRTGWVVVWVDDEGKTEFQIEEDPA